MVWRKYVIVIFTSSCVLNILCNLKEGPEGVKWKLGLACFCPGKMGFRSLGLGFGRWEWEKKYQKWEWDKYFVTMTSRDITYFLGLRHKKIV